MHEVSSYLTSLPNHDPQTWPPLDDDGDDGSAPQTELSAATTTTTTTALTATSSIPITIQLESLEKRISAFLSSLPHHIHFEKPELLMMINNRPESQAELYLVVEDVETRMSEADQSVVLDCIKRFWGGKWGDEEEEGQQGEGGHDDGEGGEEAAEEEMEE